MPDTNHLAIRDLVMDVIYKRRSVRKFTDEPVSEEDIKYILEAGRWAPSGENSQGWRFIVIKDKEIIKKLGEISGHGSARRFTGEFVSKRMHKRFATLKDEEKKKAAFQKLMSGDVSRFVGTAPVVIAVAGKMDVWDLQIDNAAAIENMLIMISALGLGATWVIAPCTDIRDELEVCELLGVPKDYKLISIIPLGHMERLPRPRPRLELKDITYQDKFNNPYFTE
ncbi:MAG: nitroreductase family protein [Tepidanaerobacteraceae bacterium]